MKLANSDLQALLAGEYVLGTLKGRARRRFEALLKNRADLRAAVKTWENNLAPLALDIEPISPPPDLWRRIEKDIQDGTQGTRPAGGGFWPLLALAASLAAVVFGGLFVMNLNPRERPLTVAVLGNSTRPAWVMTLAASGRVLEVAAIHPSFVKGHSYQLWMLPGKGQAPRSLGLLPRRPGATLRVAVPAHLHLASAQGLAVSIEPPHGSPLPGPSGPVVYQATWLHIVRSS